MKNAIREIEKKSGIRTVFFEETESKLINIDISNIPLAEIAKILKQIGYSNVAVIPERQSGDLIVYILSEGVDASAFTNNASMIRPASFSASTNRSEPSETISARANEAVRPKTWPAKTGYVENEVILRRSPNLPVEEMDGALERYGLIRVPSPTLEKIGYIKATIPQGKTIQNVLNEIQRDTSFATSEPNYLLDSLSIADPLYSSQWSIPEIHLDAAWDLVKRHRKITVAIVDSGVDASHPDLNTKVLKGYDFVNSDEYPMDDNGHGTFVAGIIAANWNSEGIRGGYDGAAILPVKAIDSGGVGTYEHTACGIIWAADQGVDIINLSIGGYGYSSMLQDAVNYALATGCILVAAGGNDAVSTPMYPAAYPDVIGVSALGVDGGIWPFSNTGQHIDICAPGENIISTGMGDGYVYASGTSASTALVSAVAAMAISEKPDQSVLSIVRLITSSATDLGAQGWDAIYGFGEIHASNLLETKVTSFHDMAVRSIDLNGKILNKGQPLHIVSQLQNTGTYPVETCKADWYVIRGEDRTLIESATVQARNVIEISTQWMPSDITKEIQFEIVITCNDDQNLSNNTRRTNLFTLKEDNGLVYVQHKSEPNMQVHQFLAGEGWELVRRYIEGEQAYVLQISSNTLSASNVSQLKKNVEETDTYDIKNNVSV